MPVYGPPPCLAFPVQYLLHPGLDVHPGFAQSQGSLEVPKLYFTVSPSTLPTSWARYCQWDHLINQDRLPDRRGFHPEQDPNGIPSRTNPKLQLPSLRRQNDLFNVIAMSLFDFGYSRSTPEAFIHIFPLGFTAFCSSLTALLIDRVEHLARLSRSSTLGWFIPDHTSVSLMLPRVDDEPESSTTLVILADGTMIIRPTVQLLKEILHPRLLSIHARRLALHYTTRPIFPPLHNTTREAVISARLDAASAGTSSRSISWPPTYTPPTLYPTSLAEHPHFRARAALISLSKTIGCFGCAEWAAFGFPSASFLEPLIHDTPLPHVPTAQATGMSVQPYPPSEDDNSSSDSTFPSYHGDSGLSSSSTASGSMPALIDALSHLSLHIPETPLRAPRTSPDSPGSTRSAPVARPASRSLLDFDRPMSAPPLGGPSTDLACNGHGDSAEHPDRRGEARYIGGHSLMEVDSDED